MASALFQSPRAAAAAASANCWDSWLQFGVAGEEAEEEGLRRNMRSLPGTATIFQLRQLGDEANLVIETAHIEERRSILHVADNRHAKPAKSRREPGEAGSSSFVRHGP